jgi:predicted lipoprotein
MPRGGVAGAFNPDEIEVMLPPFAPPRAARLALALLLCLAAVACRVEKRSAQAATGGEAPPPGGQFTNQAFDPKAQVSDIWDSKVLPALQAKAGDFAALRSAMKTNLDDAGAKYGYRKHVEGAPWNFATRLKGKIVSVDTESSAGKIGVDADGDGRADATVQIGPILRGTALRDSLPFISFTEYANQVEFAQLANAFNDQAYARAMKPMPREALAGREIELLGVFTSDDASETPVITPVQLTLGGP